MNKSDLQMGLHFYQELQVPSSATVKGCSSRPVDCSPTELAAVDFKEGNDTVFIPFPLIFIFSPFPEFCLTQTYVAKVLEMQGIWKEEAFKTSLG